MTVSSRFYQRRSGNPALRLWRRLAQLLPMAMPSHASKSRSMTATKTSHGSAAGRAARAAASMIKASLSRLSKSARASLRTSPRTSTAPAGMHAGVGNVFVGYADRRFGAARLRPARGSIRLRCGSSRHRGRRDRAKFANHPVEGFARPGRSIGSSYSATSVSSYSATSVIASGSGI